MFLFNVFWVFCLDVSLYIMCMSGAFENQKKAPDTLEQELQMLQHAMWMGMEPGTSGRAASVVDH